MHYSLSVFTEEDYSEDIIDQLLDPYYEDEYNPDGKWDWYQIGGRWNNLLKLKSGAYTNSGKIKELDFSIDQKVYQEAERFWEVVVDGAPLKEEEKKLCTFASRDYYIDLYETKEEYARLMASFQTYACLTPDGIWHLR